MSISVLLKFFVEEAPKRETQASENRVYKQFYWGS